MTTSRGSTRNLFRASTRTTSPRPRRRAEVDTIIGWLTGYDDADLDAAMEADFETFFDEAPGLNPDRRLITGVVCGVRVEDIEEPTMQEIRYLDKLVDELARGKAMEKILRSA